MFRPKGVWLSFAAFLFDICAAAFAWVAAYWVRFNGMPPHAFAVGSVKGLVWVMVIYAVMFRAFGLYRGMWAFASLPDLVRIGKAVAGGGIAVVVAASLIQPNPIVPRSVLFVAPLLLFVIMGGARAVYRMTKEHLVHGGLVSKGKPVIVIGAGRAGAILARELAVSPDWRLVGMLDDDLTKVGRELYGYRVLGTSADVETWAKRLKAEYVIMATPGADAEQHRKVTVRCVRAGLRVLVLPSIVEGPPGAVLAQVRKVNPEDMLGRDPVTVGTEATATLLAGRVVMVTGAGGSIGSELCRQILKFGPAQLIAYDFSEFAVYRLGEELQAAHGKVPMVQIVGDVRDALLLQCTMSRYKPVIVFHAAAYKHVPLMEENNAWQAVRNNVLGTYELAKAAINAQVERFVLISTDKAVNPTNVMGASKRLAEMVCQVLQQETSTTHFETVRFGNVLGSAGSVIPKFEAQIAKGGPITVTHPDITRYFMTIPEASQLVLQASAMGRGGEIFVFDMGEPVRIADLARDLIRLHGFQEEQIGIAFTGLRPGEKLYEELLADGESTRATHHPKVRIARAREVEPAVLQEIIGWLTQPVILDDDAVRLQLMQWLQEYVPTGVTKPLSDEKLATLTP